MTANEGAEALKPPKYLGRRGRRFWRRVTADFDLSDSEFELLTEACRCMDRLEALDTALRERGPFIPGSAGQEVLNPAAGEARQQQIVLHRLLAALKLQDDEGQDMGIPSAKVGAASTAAHARWSGGRV